jgi:hypothetical protein
VFIITTVITIAAIPGIIMITITIVTATTTVAEATGGSGRIAAQINGAVIQYLL